MPCRARVVGRRAALHGRAHLPPPSQALDEESSAFGNIDRLLQRHVQSRAGKDRSAALAELDAEGAKALAALAKESKDALALVDASAEREAAATKAVGARAADARKAFKHRAAADARELDALYEELDAAIREVEGGKEGAAKTIVKSHDAAVAVTASYDQARLIRSTLMEIRSEWKKERDKP